MSYTILHAVPEKGAIQQFAVFPNSHIWARDYWEWLGDKYLGMSPIEVMGKGAQQIWNLTKDSRLSTDEKIGLGATFDWVMVKDADVPKLIPAFTHIGNISQNTRWGEMAGALDSYIGSHYFGVCWTATSVVDAWYVPDGDDVRLYDVSRDNKHWFLFDGEGNLRI